MKTNEAKPLINTGALARWKNVGLTWELFQQFSASVRKPLKLLRCRVRPFIRVLSSFGSALSFLCCLLFKAIWLRAALCALYVLLWQHALADVHYVDGNSTNATPPYTNWSTAATNIQDAVDAALAGDEVVVTNGTYATGGRAETSYPFDASRVAVDKPLNLRSVNGPESTTIDGGGWGRCVFLTNSTALSGFTLTNGLARRPGGGVWCASSSALVSNCVISGNQAVSGGGASGGTLNNCTLTGNQAVALAIDFFGAEADGGGAYGCTLNECTLSGNSASVSNGYLGGYAAAQGGGAYGCTLNNCTLSGNSASVPDDEVDRLALAFGGGAFRCTLNNCTLSGNSVNADDDGSGDYGVDGGGAFACEMFNCISFANYIVEYTFGYCEDCFSPGKLVAGNNWVGDPLFVAGSLRLQPNSPCINAGYNPFVTTATDLDGNPRISGGTVDIGAYEFQFNHAPLALATVAPLFAIPQGGTNRFILSPNNAAATVVLDGSQSSDADNDPLTYLWLSTLNSQPSTPFATGALATNQFAIGPHTVRLVVSDGHDTATAQVSFEVITPATAVGQLMAVVDEANLGGRNQQPLLTTLSAAMSAFERGNFKAGANQVSAFQNKVRAQIAPWNPALAGELIAASQSIADVASGR